MKFFHLNLIVFRNDKVVSPICAGCAAIVDRAKRIAATVCLGFSYSTGLQRPQSIIIVSFSARCVLFRTLSFLVKAEPFISKIKNIINSTDDGDTRF